ncbi:alpha/beta hydrolase [Phormidium yuhuli AB48]|uniref:Alpha/beta hydrolase n=1 Tax=Phormidium yuhuli AB48 TaxID=2940671 RepID=A0ABY5AN01_9CYAN|nr:alpha/beta hydrolase [Phormidium yuhuli]USR90583.1 alpha/beta hydrolase [Phormidium yuhuli AB48]
MSNSPQVIWLNPNPSWRRFHRPLMQYLSQTRVLAEWEYSQTADEPSSLDIAVNLLDEYLCTLNQPVHLIGHSTGGTVGLLYSRRHPERVKTLSLLGVGCHPAIDWQAHYYVQRQLLPCSREMLLGQMVRSIVGSCSWEDTKLGIKILEADLLRSPSPHSLYHRDHISPAGVAVPLFVCGSRGDTIVDRRQLQGWIPWLKRGDRLWEHPGNTHVFHYFDPNSVGDHIRSFWQYHAQTCFLHPQAA